MAMIFLTNCSWTWMVK